MAGTPRNGGKDSHAEGAAVTPAGPLGAAGAGAPAAGREASHVRRVLVIWVALSAVGIALTLVIVPIISPTSASSVMGFANLTDLLFTVLAVPVALFVWVFVFYSLVAFRVKAPATGRVEDLEDGPPLEAKPWQQILWLLVTATLAIFLVGWGTFGFYRQTTDPPANPLLVKVIGQQWTWTYSYPSLGVQSHVLVLPVGRPVDLRITSGDVVHGFFVHGLGVSMNANPGRWVDAPIVTPTRIGNLTARCIELCGLYHTYMWTEVRVVSAASFASWVSSQRGAS